MNRETQNLTMVEFSEADHEIAERVARELGYEQTAYTSTSALWGLFCLPENPATHPTGPYVDSCIVKTKELGFLVIQTLEDLGLTEDGRGQVKRHGGRR